MSAPVLDIVCLCAAWCGTCREYADTFRALAAARPAHRTRWIDIEDEADLVGDIDVETFPTLMLACQGQVLFAGPVLPRLGDAQRLVDVHEAQAQAVLDGQGAWPTLGTLGLPRDQAEAYTALAQTVARA
jgi:thiol-disulfide isomerase/thioredoxin